MFEELIIWGPQVADEHDTLAELSEKDRAYLAKELEELDDKWGISLNKTSYVNSYQNDDYLFVAGLLQEVRDIHKKSRSICHSWRSIYRNVQMRRRSIKKNSCQRRR